MNKPITKSAAVTAMALLGQAMDRNTHLAGKPASNVPAAQVQPVPAEKPSPPATPVAIDRVTSPQPRRVRQQHIRSTGLRLTPDDHERVNRIVRQALNLGERIPLVDAVRLALIAYNPSTMTISDLKGLNAQDRRTRDGKESM